MGDRPGFRAIELAAARGAVAALALLAVGCSTVRVTDPRRTATEQFLLSEAAASAVQQLEVGPLRDRKVFVVMTEFGGAERDFVVGELYAHLLAGGVRVVERQGDAEILLRVRSRGVGIDRYEYLLGVPPFLVPQGSTSAAGVPAANDLITPEIAIFKRTRQFGFASVAIVAYWADSGEIVASSGPFVGRTRRRDFWFLSVGPTTSGNVPPVSRGEDD